MRAGIPYGPEGLRQSSCGFENKLIMFSFHGRGRLKHHLD